MFIWDCIEGGNKTLWEGGGAATIFSTVTKKLQIINNIFSYDRLQLFSFKSQKSKISDILTKTHYAKPCRMVKSGKISPTTLAEATYAILCNNLF